MRAVVQRVVSANVKVDSKQISKIDNGIVVFLGVDKEDSDKDADYMASKLMGLRIFEDEFGKMNLSLKDVGGRALIVSQFTLLGDCRKGKRPSFDSAAGPEKANTLYEHVIEKCRQHDIVVEKGAFRENMLVELINAGPVTILLDSKKTF